MGVADEKAQHPLLEPRSQLRQNLPNPPERFRIQSKRLRIKSEKPRIKSERLGIQSDRLFYGLSLPLQNEEGTTEDVFKDCCLKAKARIWLQLY